MKTNNHKTKRRQIYMSVLALILSISTVWMTRIHFNGVWGLSDVNYVDKFGISAFVLGCILFLAFLAAINLGEQYASTFVSKICSYEKEQDERKIIIFWAVIIFLAWLPYYLSYYPGGVYADTLGSISFVMSDLLTNRHPFLYTMIIGLFMHIGETCGKDLTWSIGLFTAVQMLVMGCEFLYCISWMLRHRINRFARIASSLFWVFFSLIPLYSISVWKDTPFCMAVWFWMMFTVDLYLGINNGILRFKTVFGFLLGGSLVAFTRNNGTYVVVLSVLVLTAVCLKKVRKDKCVRNVVFGSIAMVGIIIFIQGPFYNMVGIAQTETVENLGIPLQQIGAVVAYDGVITEEQKGIINNFIPYENIKEHYSPSLADNLKWYTELNGQYLSEHKAEFLNIWIQLLRQNPSIYIKAYIMATLGFWDVDVTTSDAYVQNFIWNDSAGIVQKDYFSEWFGFSFRHFVNPRHYISCAWFFWIFFVASVFTMERYGERSIFAFTPQLGIWLTIMLATPIAVSLRYIAANMFTLPFVIIVPLLLERQKTDNISVGMD